MKNNECELTFVCSGICISSDQNQIDCEYYVMDKESCVKLCVFLDNCRCTNKDAQIEATRKFIKEN